MRRSQATESTSGTTTARSRRSKVTLRISASAFMPAARNAGRSAARTGPKVTRKPQASLTL